MHILQQSFPRKDALKISFATFGCRLNQAEALDLEARLAACGHQIIPLPRSSSFADSDNSIAERSFPDLIIVRGCSVTAKAEQDCEETISHLQARFPSARIIRMGCLPNATPLPQLLFSLGSDPSTRPVPMATSRAYLKIQDGCNGKCAFCIVPHFRGKSVSTPFDEILIRAKEFLVAGYNEIVVTGCNLALYKDNGRNLAEVLHSLAGIGVRPLHANLAHEGSDPTRHRIRIGSLEPGICGVEILDVIEKNPNICRFLHLSLQSGSDRILKRMNRPYGIAEINTFIDDARIRFGEKLCLGADVITGFPNESDEDFNATRSFLEKHNFTNVHVFPYSERPGTPAATMEGSVPFETRKRRAKILSADAQRRKMQFAEMFVGQDVEVCVERGGDHGWSGEYLPVRLATKRPRRALVKVRIAAVKDGILYANPSSAMDAGK